MSDHVCQQLLKLFPTESVLHDNLRCLAQPQWQNCTPSTFLLVRLIGQIVVSVRNLELLDEITVMKA